MIVHQLKRLSNTTSGRLNHKRFNLQQRWASTFDWLPDDPKTPWRRCAGHQESLRDPRRTTAPLPTALTCNWKRDLWLPLVRERSAHNVSSDEVYTKYILLADWFWTLFNYLHNDCRMTTTNYCLTNFHEMHKVQIMNTILYYNTQRYPITNGRYGRYIRIHSECNPNIVGQYRYTPSLNKYTGDSTV